MPRSKLLSAAAIVAFVATSASMASAEPASHLDRATALTAAPVPQGNAIADLNTGLDGRYGADEPGLPIGDGSSWGTLSFNDLLASALADLDASQLERLDAAELLVRRIMLSEGEVNLDLEAAGLSAEHLIRLGLVGVPTSPTAPVGQPIVNPVPGANLFDSFGFARSGGRTHRGIDIFAPAGSPIVAAVGGVVVRVRGPGGRTEGALGGRSLIVAGSDGHFYYYAHNSRNLVSEGEVVVKGQPIALVGNTGNARLTPPHLHFAISVGGNRFSESRAVNPYPLLVAAGSGLPLPPFEHAPETPPISTSVPAKEPEPAEAPPTTSTTSTTAPSTTAPPTTVPPTTTPPSVTVSETSTTLASSQTSSVSNP